MSKDNLVLSLVQLVMVLSSKTWKADIVSYIPHRPFT